MLDFLKNAGIDYFVIEDLKKTYDSDNLYTLYTNEYEAVKIINYFKSLGIEYIEEMLVYCFNVFIYSLDEVKAAFKKYGEKKCANLINKDYYLINKILLGNL